MGGLFKNRGARLHWCTKKNKSNSSEPKDPPPPSQMVKMMPLFHNRLVFADRRAEERVSHLSFSLLCSCYRGLRPQRSRTLDWRRERRKNNHKGEDLTRERSDG